MGLTNQLAALLRANPKLANARDSFGRTPLHYAVLAQSNTTALLLQAGADAAVQTTRPAPAVMSVSWASFPVGYSPLHMAVWADNRAGAQLLIKAGAPLAQADADGNTPLHNATPYRIEMQKLLISAGAPLDLTNRAGKTPLRIAFDYGDTEDFALLLKAGARKDIGLSNTTLLHLAASPGGDWQPPIPRAVDGAQTLHLATAPGGDWQGVNPPFIVHDARADTIPTLVAAGLAVDMRDGQGRTPFQLAVTALNLDAMGLLLTNGANINAVDPRGNTALHQLSMRPVDTVQIIQPGYMPAQQAKIALDPTTNISLTAWLLDHGANPNLTNRDGQTPVDLLRAHKWANADEEKDAATRIALLLKPGVQAPTTKMKKD
jgi:ankyrin repeat protein